MISSSSLTCYWCSYYCFSTNSFPGLCNFGAAHWEFEKVPMSLDFLKKYFLLFYFQKVSNSQKNCMNSMASLMPSSRPLAQILPVVLIISLYWKVQFRTTHCTQLSCLSSLLQSGRAPQSLLYLHDLDIFEGQLFYRSFLKFCLSDISSWL